MKSVLSQFISFENCIAIAGAKKATAAAPHTHDDKRLPAPSISTSVLSVRYQITPMTHNRTQVITSEISRDGRQPARFEKKKNISCSHDEEGAYQHWKRSADQESSCGARA
jgi:hypothetical protein